MGGLTPLRAFSQAVFPPRGGAWFLDCHPMGATLWGCFPSNPPQDGPPLGIARICLGVFLSRSLPIFTDLYRLSWEIFLVISRVSIPQLTTYFTCMFFFSGIVLRRNHLIDRVELFEEKSILVFPECLEASEW